MLDIFIQGLAMVCCNLELIRRLKVEQYISLLATRYFFKKESFLYFD